MVIPELTVPPGFALPRPNDPRPALHLVLVPRYWWLRDETPEDARVMAWWDYGYVKTTAIRVALLGEWDETSVRGLRHSRAPRDGRPPHLGRRRQVGSPVMLTFVFLTSTLLQVPDHWDREPDLARGRQHLEPRAHRAAREVPGHPGARVPQDHPPPRRLRPGQSAPDFSASASPSPPGFVSPVPSR